MGNYTSKFFFQNSEDANTKITSNNVQVNSLKVCNSFTPVSLRKKFMTDPRSATAEILRTPIEVDCTPVRISKKAISAIPKHLKVRLGKNNDIKKQSLTEDKPIDPRSPTINLQRTPISDAGVLSSSSQFNITKSEDQPGELTPIHFGQYVCSNLDPRSPSIEFDRTPILISRPDKNQQIEPQQDLNTQLEENNIQSKLQFCETSLFNTSEIQALINETDEVKHSESDNSSYASIIDKSELQSSKNTDDYDDDDDDKLDSYKKNLKNEVTIEVNNFKVWRDSSSEKLKQLDVSESNSSSTSYGKFSQLLNEVNEIKDVPMQFEHDNRNNQDVSENKKLKLNPNDTNGKNCIHISKVQDSLKRRTPLSNRCNNGQFGTIITKSPQHTLQSKNLNIVTQQENTPPHKKHNLRSQSKNIQWDTNSTVII